MLNAGLFFAVATGGVTKIIKKQSAKNYSKNFGRFIGTSPAMREVYKKIQLISEHSTPVFITGESGTGKELCAQSIHYYSEQSDYHFVPINCAAIPENLFEATLFGHVQGAFTSADYDRKGAIEEAENGTLFLDEITEIPIEMQAKLLRFVEDQIYQKVGCDKQRQANVRIICSTNRNVQNMIDKKTFRADLYYRLYVAHIELPTLKKRSSDILDLADYFLHDFSDAYNKSFSNFSTTVEKLLESHEWKGNVRELKNTIEKIVILNDEITVVPSMLPNHILKTDIKEKTSSENFDLQIPLWQIEKNAIQKTIDLCKGNIVQAAAVLDISPSTIYRKIQSWEKRE